jgi:hypothetical protein
MAKIIYKVNHHGSDGYRLAGQVEEVSDAVAKGLKKAKVADLVKEEKEETEATGRTTKEDKDADAEENK